MFRLFLCVFQILDFFRLLSSLFLVIFSITCVVYLNLLFLEFLLKFFTILGNALQPPNFAKKLWFSSSQNVRDLENFDVIYFCFVFSMFLPKKEIKLLKLLIKFCLFQFFSKPQSKSKIPNSLDFRQFCYNFFNKSVSKIFPKQIRKIFVSN